MTDVPTYPFQCLHNYPSYIPTRAEFIGATLQTEPKSLAPTFVVDQALCDFWTFIASQLFDAKDSEYLVSILSMRPGSLGLNLQTADTVVM